jgi:hypothetical protein
MPRLVCCTAEVRQMQRRASADAGGAGAGAGEGSLAVLALGRQRAEVLQDSRGGPASQVRACAGEQALL